MRTKQLTIVPMLLSAGVLLAQGPNSMGQNQQNSSQSQQGLFSSNQVQPVQEDVPFGAVNGRLVSSGNNLIFIDDQQPQNSFVISRNDIQDVTYNGSMVTMSLNRPVRDVSGERSTIHFRFQNPAAATMVTSFVGPSGGSSRTAMAQGAQSSTSGVQAASASTGSSGQQQGGRQQSGQMQGTVTSAQPNTQVFDVKRDKFIGSDTGRLFITPKQVIFQSLSNPGASRTWDMSAIKEVNRKNPYEISVKPYAGKDYNFKVLSGSGVSTAEYVALVDNINRAHLWNNQMIQTDGAAAVGTPNK